MAKKDFSKAHLMSLITSESFDSCNYCSYEKMNKRRVHKNSKNKEDYGYGKNR